MIKDFFGVEVKIGDYILCDSIGKSKGVKAIARIIRLAEKSVWVKFPAISYSTWNGYQTFASPSTIEHNKIGVIGTKEWNRQWFVKLSQEQIDFARQNIETFYGDL